jgi:tripartite-type tricarboxylate transporter receptor subunit TctC
MALSGIVPAQAGYPDRPIRMLVGFSPGGPTDVIARKVGVRLGPIVGQTIVVENKPGAATTIAMAELARAKPDGYTLYFGGSGAYATTPLTVPNLSYDVSKDFSPIAKAGSEQIAFAVHPSVSATSLGELAALIKANPGKYNFGHSGTGNITHLTGELFKQQAGGLDFREVAYKGAGPAVNDLLGGHIPMIVAGLGSVYHLHQDGKLRVIAIAAEERTDIAPDIPTAKEAGYPGVISTSTFVLLAPANTPPAIVDSLSGAVRKVMDDETFLEELRAASVTPGAASTPSETARFLATEVSKWKALAKSIGLKVQ